MRTEVTKHMGPPANVTSQAFSDEKVQPTTAGVSNNGLEFHQLLKNSNQQALHKRNAENKGDLSQVQNDEELFELLNKQTEQRRTPKTTLDKDDFLKLFVTQLQNQDPLNPKDHSDMAAQLAQFNGLEQMLNVNKTLEKMSAAQETDRSIDLLHYIGKEIEVGGGDFRLQNGKPQGAQFNLEQPLENVQISIRDAAGKKIQEIPIKQLDKGSHSLEWDGLDQAGQALPDGSYSFSIEQYDTSGAVKHIPISRRLLVEGVVVEDGQQTLNTASGIFSVSDVKSVHTSMKDQVSSTQPQGENNLHSPPQTTPEHRQGADSLGATSKPKSHSEAIEIAQQSRPVQNGRKDTPQTSNAGNKGAVRPG